MRIAELIILIVLLMGATGYGGYKYGHGKGNESGFDTGYSIGRQDLVEELKPVAEEYDAKYSSLETQYNILVNDYNELAGSIQYQAQQPVTCNNYTYSLLNSSTTTCY